MGIEEKGGWLGKQPPPCHKTRLRTLATNVRIRFLRSGYIVTP